MVCETVYSFAQGIFHCIQAFEGPVHKIIFPDIIPDMFHRIEFRTIRGLPDNSQIFRQLELLGNMPARLVHQNYHEILLKIPGHLLQEELHHVGIGPGQYQRGQLPQRRTDRHISIQVFPDHLSRSNRSTASGSPGPPHSANPPKPSFIFRQNQRRPPIFWISCGQNRSYLFSKGFF